MAGQPQEPSWTPSGQEETQARPAWPQQPTFTPPGGSQEAYGYPPQPAPGGYPPPSGYPAQEQGYGQERAYAQEQGYPAQDQQYQAQPDPGETQWQSVPGMPPARPGGSGRLRPAGQRGFLSSLFDFGFTSMVTPKIIKVLYILITIWTLGWAAYLLALGFIKFGTGVGLLVLIIIDPLLILLSLCFYRVILEAFMVVFRIYEEIVKVREHGDRQARQL
jgi:hypothetical protein